MTNICNVHLFWDKKIATCFLMARSNCVKWCWAFQGWKQHSKELLLLYDHVHDVLSLLQKKAMSQKGNSQYSGSLDTAGFFSPEVVVQEVSFLIIDLVQILKICSTTGVFLLLNMIIMFHRYTNMKMTLWIQKLNLP